MRLTNTIGSFVFVSCTRLLFVYTLGGIFLVCVFVLSSALGKRNSTPKGESICEQCSFKTCLLFNLHVQMLDKFVFYNRQALVKGRHSENVLTCTK